MMDDSNQNCFYIWLYFYVSNISKANKIKLTSIDVPLHNSFIWTLKDVYLVKVSWYHMCCIEDTYFHVSIRVRLWIGKVKTCSVQSD